MLNLATGERTHLIQTEVIQDWLRKDVVPVEKLKWLKWRHRHL